MLLVIVPGATTYKTAVLWEGHPGSQHSMLFALSMTSFLQSTVISRSTEHGMEAARAACAQAAAATQSIVEEKYLAPNLRPSA